MSTSPAYGTRPMVTGPRSPRASAPYSGSARGEIGSVGQVELGRGAEEPSNVGSLTAEPGGSIPPGGLEQVDGELGVPGLAAQPPRADHPAVADHRGVHPPAAGVETTGETG